MSALDRFYEIFPWPMRPGDPKARERFASIVELFGFLLDRHPFLEFLHHKDVIHVIDVMAGSGIAGAALSKALASRGKKVYLTVSDARAGDLEYASEWLRGVGGVSVEVVVADSYKIHSMLKGRAGHYDVALIWGLSTPHLDPWELIRTYSSISYVLSDPGVLVVEEADRIYEAIYHRGFKDFGLRVAEDGRVVVTLDISYDIRRGAFEKALYMLPGFSEVARVRIRYWDLASTAAIGWLFFKDVDMVPQTVHRVLGCSHVIIMKNPRRLIEPEELEENPKMLQEGRLENQ